MPKRRDPEQRSATSAPQPGQAPAKPTGNEIYRAEPLHQERPPESEPTEEELAEMDELQAAVENAYDRLGEAATELTERLTDAYSAGRAFVRDNPASTVAGAFAVGIVLGLIASDD